jgi:hypothetical protein
MNRDCIPQIWLAIDPALRMELLETVAHGAPRDPSLNALYQLAEQMLQDSAERVMAKDAGGWEKIC